MYNKKRQGAYDATAKAKESEFQVPTDKPTRVLSISPEARLRIIEGAKKSAAARIKDLKNKVFNELTVKEFLGSRTVGTRESECYWKCLCSCGSYTETTSYNLTSGAVKSCGHLMVRRTHDMTFSPEYRAWDHMIQRCNNPNDAHYHRYGGRGIKVCERWLASFESFFSDVGIRPSSRHSLGRTNNNGNYEPTNVTWETIRQQSINKSTTVFLEAEGISLCQEDWCKKLNCSSHAIRSWIKINPTVPFQEYVDAKLGRGLTWNTLRVQKSK